MARVLGLDLGSHTLKGVIVETTYRGATVKSYFTAPVPPDGERIDRLKAALPKLVEQGAALVDSIVISLPGTTLATHPIALPFSDPKKIESTLAFEVESQLPYDLSDAIFDHQVGVSDTSSTLNETICGCSASSRAKAIT